MKYQPLLTITLTHSYYSDGRCLDFNVIPNAASASLLRNHRCVTKPRQDGLDIYAALDADTNTTLAIPFDSSDSLSFDLLLRNPEFSLYTDTSSLPKSNSLQIEYLDLQLSRNKFATLAVPIDSKNNNIKIAFNAKPLLSVYCLVTDTTDTSSFSIVSNDQTITWQKVDIPPSSNLANQLSTRYQSQKILWFVSTQSIPCSETGVKSVQLKSGANTLFGSLPNPSYRNFFQTDLIFSTKAQEAIYQIVKYLTNSQHTV